MDRTEIQALIDRVIGKKGIMRAPSWWVRRLFNKVIEYGESYANAAVKDVKVYVDNAKTVVDSDMSDSSTNPVQNKIVKAYTDNAIKNVKVEVDSEMSDESENPVQNKVIKAYVDMLDMHEGSLAGSTVALHNNTKYVLPLERYSSFQLTVDDDTAARGYRAIIEFTTLSGNFGLSINLPESIKWANGIAPLFMPMTKYVIDIVNGVAICMAARDRAALELSDIEDIDTPYFTIIAMDDDCEVSFEGADTQRTRYAIGSGLWRNGSGSQSVILNAGQRIAFKSYGNPNINVSKRFYATGSILSLCRSSDGVLSYFDVHGLFSGSQIVGCSKELFAGITQIEELGSNLEVFYGLFSECRLLKKAPDLPSCAIPEACCDLMFNNCISLEIAPELPSTELSRACYKRMFQGCRSLRVPPQLPATTLAEYCYDSMFYLCTSLRVAPELPATVLEEGCYRTMFASCAALTNSPILRAGSLAPQCYKQMFYYCKSLNDVTMLAQDVSATDCMESWLRYVKSTGTFSKITGVDIQSGDSGIPDGWSVYDYNETEI